MRSALLTVAAAVFGAVLAFIVALALFLALLTVVGRGWFPPHWEDTTMWLAIFFAWFAAPPLGAGIVGTATYRALKRRDSTR